MSQSEWFTTYLEYENLNEMLNVILYTSQSFMAILPQLYHITYHDKEILFIHTGLVGGIVAHYNIINEKPNKKFVELNKMTSYYGFVDAVGSNPQCIYIPIVRLNKSTLRFPVATHGLKESVQQLNHANLKMGPSTPDVFSFLAKDTNSMPANSGIIK